MNYFMYTLKFDNSPCGEISTSPTQRCVLQTGSHTSHDSKFRWSKCFKEARNQTVLSSHCTYYMFLHIQKLWRIWLLILTICLGINIEGRCFENHMNLVFTHKRKLRNTISSFNYNKPKISIHCHRNTRRGRGFHIFIILLDKTKV